MTFDIHVTVELQPSPQLVQLLEALQPGTQPPADPEWPQIKPRKPQEEPNKLEPKPTPVPERGPLKEIEYFPPSEFTTPGFVAFKKYSQHLEYAETEDGRLVIKYYTTYIYTTWSDMLRLVDSLPNKFKFTGVKLLEKKTGNKPVALRAFIRAVMGGLRKGQAAGSQVDPDAEFRPILQQNTRADYDGGKIEGSLEG